MKLQVYALSLSYVALFTFISLYIDKLNKPLLAFITVYAIALLIINNIAPYSLRFSAPAELREFQFLGQSLHMIHAEHSIYGKVLHWFGLIYLSWAIYIIAVLLREKRNLFTLGLVTFILLFVITGSIGAQIDKGKLNAVYALGFVFTAFVIFISALLQKQLQKQKRQLDKYRSSIEVIARGVSYQSGHLFYEHLVTHLGTIFDAKYCFIGLLDSGATTVKTKALSADGDIIKNFSYALSGSPCERVLGKEVCHYPDDVQTLFPEDTLLKDMDIHSYIGAPIVSEDGHPVGLLVVLDGKRKEFSQQMQHILDIFSARASAELQRDMAEKKMRKMAYEDYLTRLPNRAQAYEFLQEKTGKHDPLCIYLLDLDHFKNINDALGHDIGDELLRSIGNRLSALTEDTLFKSRVGGDEFLIVSSNYSNLLMEQLQQIFREPVIVGDHVIDLHCSIGIAEIAPQTTSVLEMMRFVELALYEAKKQGRNCSIIYEPALQSVAIEKMKLQSALKNALQKEVHLSLHYQPQVNSDGSIYGLEALLRWNDPDLGFIPPTTFIPIAEETGLIHPVGEWVLKESLDMLSKIQHHPQLSQSHMSINISAWQFALPNFVEHVIELVEQADVPKSKVMLELTETAVLSDIEDTKRKLAQLRACGIKIALDDFGTGYSSLAYLRELPIDALKIDKAFIDEIRKTTSSPLTDSIVSIGRSIQVDVIAEGVEYANQAAHLEKLGCVIYQGYFFSKPLHEDALHEWLKQPNLPPFHTVT